MADSFMRLNRTGRTVSSLFETVQVFRTLTKSARYVNCCGRDPRGILLLEEQKEFSF